MFVSPPNSYVEILTPSMMVLVGGAFGTCLGHKGRALMNEISTLKKEVPQKSLTPSTMWVHIEKEPAMNQEEDPHQSTTKFNCQNSEN